MKLSLLALGAALGLSVALCAQQGTSASGTRVETTRVNLPLIHPTQMIDKAACDGAGNIYSRTWAGDDSGTSQLPVQEITREGVLTQSFYAAKMSQIGDTAKGIFVSEAGDVYEAARTANGLYVLQFAKDGSVKASARLDAESREVDPWQLAVFKDGGYLLIGLAGKDHRTPYTAVFDANGKLVKSIYEPEDEEARQKAEGRDIAYARSNVGNRFVGLGDVATGSDGNAYLLRGASPTLIYVISPSGKVVRKLRIDAGSAEAEYVAREIRSYAGRLAIGFNGPDNLVVVTDLSGKTIANYMISRHKPDWPSLACYDSTGFTFLTTYAEKELYLLKAKLQ